MRNEDVYSNNLKFTPCGSQTLSKMPNRFIEGVYPQVVESGRDCHVWDIEGNEYVDLIAGLGAVSVGYCDSDINEAAWEQMQNGISFSLPHRLEGELAEKLTELVPGTEMWKFGKNGTDATVMAVRAARAYTGRTKIMTVGYNGCADQFEIKGVRNAGIPKELEPTITKANYNDLKSFSDILLGHYACVLMEPMVYEYPRPGFLETIRSACDASGTLLIFDEVVTGGRFEQFTAQHSFGVVPDITCLGKAIANGFPLCAVGGRRRIMEVFERDDFFASGTFGGETVSLAACLKTVDKLAKGLTRTLVNGKIIQDSFNDIFKDKAVCKGYPTRFIFEFPTKEHKALFMQEMCLNGVLIGHANMVMASMTDKDVRYIIEAIQKSYNISKHYWENPLKGLKGPLPVEAVRKS